MLFMPRRATNLEPVLTTLRHELRNVLSPITMIVDLLAARGDGPELPVLQRGVHVLGHMIEDLCALTRGGREALAVEARAVTLAKIMTEAVDATSTRLAQIGATIAMSVQPRLRIIADARWLAIAIASAIRHVATPGAKLAVGATRDGKTIVVRVSTDAAELPAATSLAFARQLVEAQGGTWATAEDPRFCFPIAPIG
jgi:signal transduction histidine kinase